MNALAMPSSSRITEDIISPCLRTTSPRMREERSATDWATRASSALSVGLAGCIPHDAIRSGCALCLTRVVQIVQVGYRLAHCKKSLVRVQRAAKHHRQELAGAALALAELALKLLEAPPVMRLELRHPVVRPAERLAVGGQHQDVGRQLAVARDGIEE